MPVPATSHGAKSAPASRLCIPPGLSWEEGNPSQAPNMKKYTNKIEDIVGNIQKAKISVNGVCTEKWDG